jgi:hypothetical protein
MTTQFSGEDRVSFSGKDRNSHLAGEARLIRFREHVLIISVGTGTGLSVSH